MESNTLIKVDCPICEKDDISPYLVVDGLNVVKCNGCGLIYFNPNVSTAEHNNFLSKDYWVSPTYQKLRASGNYNFKLYLTHLNSEDIVGYPDYLEPQHLGAKVGWGANLLKWCYNYNPDGKSIIAVGCATGHMLEPFMNDGFYPVVGVEIAPWIVESGRKLLPTLDLRLGDFNDMNIDEKFDFAMFWDSFEHLQYPNKTLSKLHNSLNDNAIVISHMPDVDDCDQDPEWYLWSPKQHCFFYNYRTLGLLLKKHGFEIIDEKVSPEAGEMVLIWRKI